MIHPTNSHFPTSKGMATQPLFCVHELKILLDQVLDVKIVVALYISQIYTKHDLITRIYTQRYLGDINTTPKNIHNTLYTHWNRIDMDLE
jgi:hypothetical protein